MDRFSFPRRFTIPSLDEIISPDTYLADCGPYNRGSFVQFLSISHCTENLEFVVELDRFLRLEAQRQDPTYSDEQIRKHDQHLHQWNFIYKVFIANDAIKEINIPCTLRLNVMAEVLPLAKELMLMRGVVYELLLDSFHEFINTTREATNDRTPQRRRLEIVAPEHPHTVSAPEMPRSVQFGGTHGKCEKCPAENHQRPSELREQWEQALLAYERPESSSDSDLPRSRNGSAITISSTRTSSRGSSMGLIVDNIKDYSGWKKTVKKFKLRRFLSNSQDSDL